MQFKMVHNNLNVLDLTRSLDFYKKALQLEEVRRVENNDFTLVYLSDHHLSTHLLELTSIKANTTPYNLGDNEIHLAFETDDFHSAYKLHKSMNCICFENPAMGIYFIEDPDGYWLEILPRKHT